MKTLKLFFATLLVTVTSLVQGQTIIDAGSRGICFDGMDDIIFFPPQTGFNVRTVECWFKPSATIDASNQNPIGLIVHDSQLGGNAGEWSLGFGSILSPGNEGKLIFTRLQGASPTVYTVVSNDNVWQAGTWYHVAAVCSSTGMKMYINGELQSDTHPSTGATSNGVNFGDLTIGGWGSVPNRNFKGVVDEARIWLTERNQQQVRENMGREIALPNIDLHAYYKMDDAVAFASQSIPNSAGSLFTGIITGGSMLELNDAYHITQPGEGVIIDFLNDPIAGVRTIEMRFRAIDDITPTSLTLPRTLLGRYDQNVGTPNQVMLYHQPSNWLNPGHLTFDIGAIRILSDANTWNAGQWYHVAIIIDPVNGVRMLVDGIQQAATIPTGTTISSSPTQAVVIGNWGQYSAQSRSWKGDIDEVRIWNTSRTNNEINANLCDTVALTLPDLKYCYRFEKTMSLPSYNAMFTEKGVPNNESVYLAILTPALQSTPEEFAGHSCLSEDICCNPAEVPITPASVYNVCAGNSVTVQITGGNLNDATSWEWYADGCGVAHVGSGTSVSLSPNITTTYYIRGEGGLCEAQCTSITVIVNQTPPVSAGQDVTTCNGTQIVLAGSGAQLYTWDNGVTDNIAFTPPLGTTTYMVQGIDGNGCVASDDVTVVVNPIPVISAGSNQTVCDNSEVVLFGNGGATYAWDNGVINGVPFTQALGTVVYTVIGTDLNGCVAISSVQVTVVEGSLDPSVTISGTTFTSNENLPGASYQWIDCDTGLDVPGATSQSFTPSVGGQYAVVVDNGVCTVTSDCNLSTANNSELNAAGALSVYPNPTNGDLTIELPNDLIGEMILIHDLQGKTIAKQIARENIQTIDLENHAGGVYILQIGTQTARVVKN